MYAGNIDTPLTDHGRAEAKVAGQEAALFGIDLIVASPLVRALETAQIIAGEIGYELSDIITDPLLVERNLGSLQGTPWKLASEDADNHPDIESLEDLGGRAQRVLNFLQTQDAPNILVVGHGSFALALCDLVGYDTNGQQLPNAHIVQLI
jgi:broad specificity phosphatase PhoE